MNIAIRNNGNAKGTVGWLANAVDHVFLGETKGGKRGAWLRLKDGTDICLVMNDPYDVGYDRAESDALEIVSRHGDPFMGLKMCVTDACWESIEALAKAVREEMRRLDSEDRPIRFELIRA